MLFRLTCLILVLAAATSALADDDFYSARVPVADRSEAALGRAASEAMTQVMVRVSGDKSIAEREAVADIIGDARNRMAMYTYEDIEAGIALYARFDESVVKSTLRAAGATFWGEERAPVLLWLVVDEPYSRRFATVSRDAELLRLLAAGFEARGVSLRLPLLDLEDAAALSPEMVWQKVLGRVRAASERYGTEHILVGRYVQLTNGDQIVDWTYLNGETSRGLQRQGRDPAPILSAAVDLVVDDMARQYAVTLKPESVYDYIDVRVMGVRGLSDYREVLSEFQAIPVLAGVRVFAVDGEQLSLRVSGVGTAEALSRLLPLKSRLQLDGEPSGRELALLWGQP